MGNKIAAGFHACVDFEMEWDQQKLEDLIREFDIKASELTTDSYVDSQRQLLLTCLGHMKAGMGAEFVPETPEICFDFAQHFNYRITIGGTAARAVTAISKLGYESALSMVCYNHYMKEQLPKKIHYYSNVGEDHEVTYPHVVLSYPANAHIQANDIDFVTPRENRVMFSRDIDSLQMVISQGFAPMITETEVMLISCFSEVLEKDILEERMRQVNELLTALPENAYVLLEDGCYINKDFRIYVHEALREKLHILSMNEDEMQEYIGRRINIMDPEAVLEAVKYMYDKIGIPVLIVHSAAWAIAYGEGAAKMGHVLEGGVTMAATRFWKGDVFGPEEYEATANLTPRQDSIVFGQKLEELSGREICCVPSKDMSFVEHPVVVGLGDSFAGGILPELTINKRG